MKPYHYISTVVLTSLGVSVVFNIKKVRKEGVIGKKLGAFRTNKYVNVVKKLRTTASEKHKNDL